MKSYQFKTYFNMYAYNDMQWSCNVADAQIKDDMSIAQSVCIEWTLNIEYMENNI